jgi:lysophospholipase L1-like esterase
MFELPLPPFRADCGRAQRRLAAQYGAVLIPRRFFARVLAEPENTVDGIHLSRQGHERMAEMMASLLAPAVVQ